MGGALIASGGPHEVRTGIGFDAHPFAVGRRLVLGGIEIPHDRGLAGWSDADVLLHAITDALLGAAALGDIGRHFPPDDPKWKGADSRVFVREAASRVRSAGWRIENVDATVLAETPRITPHVQSIEASIATELAIDAERVSVKATTLEGMGFVGREEGIAALAIATLARGAEISTP
ncbi:MAG: 2-C-methyl-D-erythritol 2,4-cyclodiphosphate synthase [Gemmatimonadota bacterium]